MKKEIIAWWSGGITSAVAVSLTLDLFPQDNVRIIFIDTKNEDEDTYRFKKDCETWYKQPIEVISAIPDKYKSIHDVWDRFNSLNVASGAVCSTDLKRKVRERWERENEFDHQVFGFELEESKRARGMMKNYGHIKPIFPLMMYGMDKDYCIRFVRGYGIKIPRVYDLGFKNNNCFNTGCVQGGIGYWQKMRDEYPWKFEKMAEVERRLTEKRGAPVTMLKDQSKEAKKSGRYQVFLLPNKSFPKHKDLSMMEGKPVEPLRECNGFCGINDLDKRKATEKEINYEEE